MTIWNLLISLDSTALSFSHLYSCNTFQVLNSLLWNSPYSLQTHEILPQVAEVKHKNWKNSGHLLVNSYSTPRCQIIVNCATRPKIQRPVLCNAATTRQDSSVEFGIRFTIQAARQHCSAPKTVFHPHLQQGGVGGSYYHYLNRIIFRMTTPCGGSQNPPKTLKDCVRYVHSRNESLLIRLTQSSYRPLDTSRLHGLPSLWAPVPYPDSSIITHTPISHSQ